MPTGKRRSRPGRARYWKTGASAAHLLPFSQALTLSLRLLDSLSTTNVNGAGLGFTWDPYSTELQNPPFPGSATLMRPFPPPASPDPCLPGTTLHCSMNSTSWLTGAQYGWKFLKTACQRSWPPLEDHVLHGQCLDRFWGHCRKLLEEACSRDDPWNLFIPCCL